ncbi:MAG: alpha-1,4-glucan--maltose-1-phosphate maltosyltransferase, partial [Actinobacteria bacterium]|nr:alpha-1,4-glucan--maltose-1-phosphate maltosyltransferase [Actinomycetota bacterium]
MPPPKNFITRGRAVIEHIEPAVECGRFRSKAVVGDDVEVTADIFRDSSDVLQASIRFRGPNDGKWHEAPMRHVDNDSWAGTFRPTEIGVYRYYIEAWTDHFATWASGLRKKVEAGQNVELELEEGALLLEARLQTIKGPGRQVLQKAIDAARDKSASPSGVNPRAAALLGGDVERVMRSNPDKTDLTKSQPPYEITVDRERARFGAWYEFFPRSTGKPGEHGTFKTAASALTRVADMGFDVVYLPPIHPIGTQFRKGKNNALECTPEDCGVPWAIGSPEGGHKAVHPDLGTIDDFDEFVAEAKRLGIDVALDFAIQCSPDHPWVTEHPEWFKHRPDGSIQYAENPPKKYQDIYPIDFDTTDRDGLWTELKSVLDHWISHGVKIFRVDNPHTKAFAFWEWCINELKAEHPDLIFLAEAFTRPKVMQHLAKLGFTQSYTYFTWRNTKFELEEYLTELTQTDMRHYFRPNFFANTPDILHEYLQTGGKPAFKIRLVLAALLSPTYGIYSGYELYENEPREEGSEEYLDSEKYEIKVRDWDRADSLQPYIKKINQIRSKHPALAQLTNLTFHVADKDNVMAFSKQMRGHDPILVVVNLNPHHWEEATVTLDLDALGISYDRAFEVHDLITDTT